MNDFEEEYQKLSEDIKEEFPKDTLMRRLAQVDRNCPQGQHGPLCLRKPMCSPDCKGGDCG